MTLPHPTPFCLEFTLSLDVHIDKEVQPLPLDRFPPAEPLAFLRGHSLGSQGYSQASDREQRVSLAYQRTLQEVMIPVEVLSYVGLAWKDPLVQRLAQASPSVPSPIHHPHHFHPHSSLPPPSLPLFPPLRAPSPLHVL